MLDRMGWRRTLGAELVKKAKASVGGQEAWHRLLTAPIKEALIAKQVLSLVIAQDSETVRREDVEQVWLDARMAAGLYVP